MTQEQQSLHNGNAKWCHQKSGAAFITKLEFLSMNPPAI